MDSQLYTPLRSLMRRASRFKSRVRTIASRPGRLVSSLRGYEFKRENVYLPLHLHEPQLRTSSFSCIVTFELCIRV